MTTLSLTPISLSNATVTTGNSNKVAMAVSVDPSFVLSVSSAKISAKDIIHEMAAAVEARDKSLELYEYYIDAGFSPDTPPEEVAAALSSLQATELLTHSFNTLSGIRDSVIPEDIQSPLGEKESTVDNN